MSLQKFLKGKSDAYKYGSFAESSACTFKSESVFSIVKEVLTKISFVIFGAEMLQKNFTNAKRGLTSCVFLQDNEILHYQN